MAQSATSTSQSTKQDDETNLDTHLYLLVGTNQGADDAKLPVALDPVIKQLRASLPFKDYRLVATLINRVKNDGHLNLKWIGGPLFSSASSAVSAGTPSFNEFRLNTVKLLTDTAGQQIVRMEGFGFGARIPIQSMQTVGGG
jgi:hypothetical protein